MPGHRLTRRLGDALDHYSGILGLSISLLVILSGLVILLIATPLHARILGDDDAAIIHP